MLKFVPHRLLLRLKWMPPARVGVVGGVVEATGFAHVDEEGCGAPDAHGAVVLLVGEDDFVALGVAPAAEGGTPGTVQAGLTPTWRKRMPARARGR